jgi:hypothetical protein
MREAEIDAWLRAAPAHLVRQAHTEAELAIAEWRRRLCRPDEQRDLGSFGVVTRRTAAAAGRAAIELAILVQQHNFVTRT